MLIQTNLKSDDYADIIDFCSRERISRSALMTSLIKEFLETTDKERRNSIIDEAKKIRPGRPKGEAY